jgi:hypothetical protein
MTTTREKHLEWCKQRALEYWQRNDLINAVVSMGSDLDKHPECRCNPFLLMAGAMYARDHDSAGVKRWIEGFG